MARLVALDATGGDSFVAGLSRIWDGGDAALPVDPRLPPPAKSHLEAEMRVGDEVAPGDALVMATSGTTGTPKGVVLTHDALAASAAATSTWLEVDPSIDRWLACLPLAHIGGLGVVTRALCTGTPVEVHAGFDADRVGRSNATLTSLVPAVLRRVDATRFRRILLGGSAIPADRPANAVATYGMTETGGGVVYDGEVLAGVELRIASSTSSAVPAEGGEIEVRGPMLLRCYRDGVDPKSTDGWFRTGDIGSLTDGILSVRGRSGDLIITGGENVWPVPVERLLESHPAVRAAAVIGRPHPDWGEQVTAVLELRAAESVPSLDELRRLVKEQLPAHCAPGALEFVDRLPRSALGKIQRGRL